MLINTSDNVPYPMLMYSSYLETITLPSHGNGKTDKLWQPRLELQPKPCITYLKLQCVYSYVCLTFIVIVYVINIGQFPVHTKLLNNRK